MNELLAIEQIKQLKARYFRALDTNDWPLLGSCLTEDFSACFRGGMYCNTFTSRQAAVDYMSGHMSGAKRLSMHMSGQPEIALITATTAEGFWHFQDMIIDLETHYRLYGSGVYQDEYCIDDGNWKICKSGYLRTFECIEPLSEEHRVMDNMFAVNDAVGATR